MIKTGTPISSITAIHFSPCKDTFIVVHCTPPYRDFVLDVGTHGVERFSELATVLYSLRLGQGQRVQVQFSENIVFNNSRKEGAPGQEITLKFATHPKPPAKPGNKFVGPKNNAAVVYY